MKKRKYRDFTKKSSTMEAYNKLSGPVPGLHWYNVDVAKAHEYKYYYSPLFTRAIDNPGKVQTIGEDFAYYDPERGQVLSYELRCPHFAHHHAFETCGTCGNYG